MCGFLNALSRNSDPISSLARPLPHGAGEGEMKA